MRTARPAAVWKKFNALANRVGCCVEKDDGGRVIAPSCQDAGFTILFAFPRLFYQRMGSEYTMDCSACNLSSATTSTHSSRAGVSYNDMKTIVALACYITEEYALELKMLYPTLLTCIVTKPNIPHILLSFFISSFPSQYDPFQLCYLRFHSPISSPAFDDLYLVTTSSKENQLIV